MDEDDSALATHGELRTHLQHLLTEARDAKEWAPRLGIPFLGFLMMMVEDEVVNQIRNMSGDRPI